MPVRPFIEIQSETWGQGLEHRPASAFPLSTLFLGLSSKTVKQQGCRKDGIPGGG